VCLLLQDLLQSCARGGGGEWRTGLGKVDRKSTRLQGLIFSIAVD
jgi:hypothetical protein